MLKQRILFVEDDEDILQLLTFAAESAGFETYSASDGKEGLALALTGQQDLVVLDLMLPGMGGLDICKELKKNPETSDIPIVMLTAKGEEVDRIVGFELGADDYVVKPFSPRELVLRIKAVLKRGVWQSGVEEAGLWRVEGLRLDLDAHQVEVDGEDIQLTATEFKLLAELIRNRGSVRTRDRLLNAVWGYEFAGYARTVDTHMRRLRQKIGDYAKYIETIRGVGYRFKK